MTARTALYAATALVLLSAHAHAGSNNNSFLDQSGERNSASITQAGDNNSAGTSLTSRRMRQQGDDNVLIIDQQSNEAFGNVRGGKAGVNYGGIDQVGAFNRLEINQNAGTVEEVQQVSTGASPAATGTTNETIVNQDKSASNVIQRIGQTFTGAGAKNLVDIDQSTSANGTTGNKVELVTQTGTGNTVDVDQRVQWNALRTIDQDGTDNSFTVDQEHQFVGGTGGNEIVLGDQDGAGNIASVTQHGAGNRVATVRQDNSASPAGGNHASLEFTGADNGQLGLGTIGGAGFAAAVAGGADRSAIQIGGDNMLDLVALGDRNQFGFSQIGDANEASGLSLTGNDNELGIDQAGDRNVVDLGAVVGNRNDIGVSQSGEDNRASIDVTDADDSDDNDVRVIQNSYFGPLSLPNVATVGIAGDRNLVDVSQTYDNEATVSIDGDDNDAAVSQVQSATANVTFEGDNNFTWVVQNNGSVATVSITGDDNNRGAFAGGITSALAGSTTSVLGVPMQVGGVFQNGHSSASITVGNLAPSDGNRFSTNQFGDGNSITGFVNGDGGNEAVVTQTGDTNVASFSQNGGMNLVAISQ